MPIASKRIVTYINENDPPFTARDITKSLLSPPVKEKKAKAGKHKKKGGSRESEALSKVGTVLNALVSIGYLEKKRKTYVKNRRFRLSGKLILNSSGNGVLKTNDGDEIIISKDQINKARNNDKVEGRLTDFRDGVYSGEIIKVLERKREQYFAKVMNRSGNYIYFKLLDTYGEMDVCAGTSKEGQKADFAILRLTDKYISGKQECVVESFFSNEDKYDVDRIVAKHSLPGAHKEYAELDGVENKVMKAEARGRKDYTKLFTITIDGERAKDFDDAVSLDVTDSGYVLYIHIADVSSYVKKGSELDREAFKRGTSYYLGNSVIPMLPELLSNNLCSLKEGEKRLTLSVEISFDKNGNETGRSFYRGIIKVDKRMTYVSADMAIDGTDGEAKKKEKKNKNLHDVLSHMFELASKLKENRLKRGRIDLNLPDYELIYDKDSMKDIRFALRLRSHLVIEEFMLSANEVVSRVLTENNIPALYRVHENISDEKMQTLRNFLRTLGISLKATSNIGVALQKVVDQVKGKEFEKVVNFIILKSFMQAYYGAEPLGHFGLGFADYTHFTSPIRRYPDLIVHRCLKSLIDKTALPYEASELGPIGEQSSELERIAQNAERDLFKLISCRFMQSEIGEVFEAVVSGIGKAGFFVALIDRPIEGMVPLRFLTDDYYLVNDDEYTVTGRKLGKRYRIGDRVRVRLKEVFYDTMRIDFEVA
ncbi:MAG: VacB/RNase II family 3'-5' exoribonuclease [Spirochaetota bacterium]